VNGLIKVALGLIAVAAPAAVFFQRADRAAFLPGHTSPGHHQIETKCQACHTPFGGVAQRACLSCHADGMEAEEDSHTAGKFEDPRNAPQLGRLDATRCVECHREHRPEQTDRMSVSARPGFCVECHRDVGRERASHAGLAFSTCADVGCHNFHDNRAVYGELLAKHRGEPDLLAAPVVPVRGPPVPPPAVAGMEGPAPPPAQLPAADAPGVIDDPARAQSAAALTAAWQRSAHARAGVNCSACHRAGGQAAAAWSWRPDPTTSCARCHDGQRRTFLDGKHGMRLAVGLSAMRPADAELPMKMQARRDAREPGLTCNRCHDAHAPDLRAAVVEGCEGCHDDGHTRAYRQSAHFAAWRAEMAGQGAPGSGVSCATCHMPRLVDGAGAAPRVWVDHNQNANLRPVDKMARSVCMSCHGLQFSLTSLADPALVAGNFAGRPRPARTGFDLLPRSKP
jgi:predicted CXXCH cytochrome family protein